LADARYANKDTPLEKALQDLAADYTQVAGQVGKKDDPRAAPKEVERMTQANAAAKKSLADVVGQMDKNDDPLAARLKDQSLAKSIDLLGSSRNALRQGVVASLRGKKLVGDKAGTKEVLDALNKTLVRADSPLVTAIGEMAGAVGGAGAGLAQVLGSAYDFAKWSAGREAEVAYLRLRERFTHSPETMLDHWIDLLRDPQSKDAKEIAREAMRDAKWVKDQDAEASAADKAKATYVLGLALRNQMKYAEALPLLEQAAKEGQTGAQNWNRDARRISRQLINAGAYRERFEELLGSGGLTRAKLRHLRDEITAALVVSKQRGVLLSLRSLVRLELARTRAKEINEKTPGVKAARQDAQAAIQAGAAGAGNYALGRIEEELGELDGAKKAFREAIAQHKGTKNVLSLYHEALARVLGQKKEQPQDDEGNDGDSDKKGDGKRDHKGKGQGDNKGVSFSSPHRGGTSLGRMFSEAVLTGAMVLFLTPAALVEPAGGEADQAQPGPDVKEAIAEAEKARDVAREAVDEARAAVKKDQPGAARRLSRAKVRLAKAYMRLGANRVRNLEWNEGLRDYRQGLTILSETNAGPQDLKAAIAGLQTILAKHPSLSRPGSDEDQNPVLAFKHYDTGRGLYREGRFADAEKEFLEASTHYKDDARFFYYLGLARLRQGTRAKIGAAKLDFEDAAKLEMKHWPESRDDVDFALESIQGPARKVVDRYRPKNLP
jgi:tetratricopeptide (TPR) repeat protein